MADDCAPCPARPGPGRIPTLDLLLRRGCQKQCRCGVAAAAAAAAGTCRCCHYCRQSSLSASLSTPQRAGKTCGSRSAINHSNITAALYKLCRRRRRRPADCQPINHNARRFAHCSIIQRPPAITHHVSAHTEGRVLSESTSSLSPLLSAASCFNRPPLHQHRVRSCRCISIFTTYFKFCRL